MNTLEFFSLVAMLVVAAASGLVGAFALMRRMTLAADAMSHVALPGLGAAMLIGINPLIGGAIALFLGAVLVWRLELKTKIATETIVGVVFSTSLAVGALLSPDHELLELLFGGETLFTWGEAIVGMVTGLVIIGLILSLKERFAISFLSADLAAVTGIRREFLEFLFLMFFVITVLLGLNFLGVLLMGSLIIVPAATAKNVAKSFKGDLFASALISSLSVLVGWLIANRFAFEIGPSIIAVAAVFFFVSLLFRD
ncbi:MAG: metal ABC transporter permease [Patescibacteria group bacterium]